MICSEMNGKKKGNSLFVIKRAANLSCSFLFEPGLERHFGCLLMQVGGTFSPPAAERCPLKKSVCSGCHNKGSQSRCFEKKRKFILASRFQITNPEQKEVKMARSFPSSQSRSLSKAKAAYTNP